MRVTAQPFCAVIATRFSRATWVFQCDSDDEMSPDAFPKLWNRREKYDAVFGFRAGRAQNAARRFLSGGSRCGDKNAVRRGVRDVNVPYRLMRAFCDSSDCGGDSRRNVRAQHHHFRCVVAAPRAHCEFARRASGKAHRNGFAFVDESVESRGEIAVANAALSDAKISFTAKGKCVVGTCCASCIEPTFTQGHGKPVPTNAPVLHKEKSARRNVDGRFLFTKF
jgi:hypothetical protein